MSQSRRMSGARFVSWLACCTIAATIVFAAVRWSDEASSAASGLSDHLSVSATRSPSGLIGPVPLKQPGRSVGESDWRSFALLVVDIQQDFCNLDIMSQNPNFAQNVTQLLEFSRANGIEVIHVRSEFDPAMKDWPASFKLMFSGGIPCVRGTIGAEPAAFAREVANERVFFKSSFDGFSNQELQDYLKLGEKKHLLVAGLTTDVCVLSTAFGAVNEGFVVSVVKDCCASADTTIHDTILSRYGGFLFDVIDHRGIANQLQSWSENLGRIYL